MLRTKNYLSLSTFFFFVLVNPAWTWADVDTNERTEAVNQQLNTIENEFSTAEPNAEKEFSSPEPDAEKVFAGTSSNPQSVPKGSEPSMQQHKSGAFVMLKELLDPDISSSPRPKIESKVKTRAHTFDMGSEIFYYRYQEPTPGEGVKNHGPMYGYYADYAYRPADPNFFNNFLTNVYMLQARYATSRDLEYNGSGIVKGKHDDVDEFRGLIGKDYNIGADSRVTPYFGFGYRYLVDYGNGEVTSTGKFGYDRKSHYYYLPLGGDAVIEMPHHWEAELNAEYDILLQGKQKSFTGAQLPGLSDLVNHQDHGFGVQASVKFLKRGPVVDFYIEPFIRYWNIEDSKVSTISFEGVPVEDGLEPKNNTTEIGSKFGIQF